MRKLVIPLAVLLMGLPTMADVFVGGELIPFHFSGGATYAKPFVLAGAYFPLDAWGPAVSFGADNPLVPNGWYFISFEGDKTFTKAAYVGIGVEVFAQFTNFTFTPNSTWAFYFKGGATFAEHLNGYIKFNIPLHADPSKPLFGAWISLGLDYWFGGGNGGEVAGTG